MTRIVAAKKKFNVFLKKKKLFLEVRNISLKGTEYFLVYWTFGIQMSCIEIFYLIVCIMAQSAQRINQFL